MARRLKGARAASWGDGMGRDNRVTTGAEWSAVFVRYLRLVALREGTDYLWDAPDGFPSAAAYLLRGLGETQREEVARAVDRARRK